MKKTKIIVFGRSSLLSAFGGSETVFFNFCNKLSTLNYSIYATIFSKSISKQTLRFVNDITFINLYDRYKINNCGKCLNLLISEINPDLIIYFFPSLYIQGKIDAKYNKIPRILMFHSRPDIYFTDGMVIKGRYVLKLLKKQYINTASQILFDSFYPLLPNFIQKGPIITVPNGINLPTKYVDIDKTKYKMVFLSRIDHLKGADLLIKSFSLLPKKYERWELDIYGKITPDYYLTYLLQLINKKHLTNRIHLKGITKTPLDVLTNYDFCVFPSYYEGFGLGLLEAQSVGLPCIGLEKCTGVNELIIDKVNGLLVKDNAKYLAKKIELLISNPDLRKQYSKQSVLSSKKYSLDSVMKLWDENIQSVLHQQIHTTLVKLKYNHKKIFPIKKITKKYSSSNYAYINFLISRKSKRIVWLIKYFLFKIFSPEGTKLQKDIWNVFYKLYKTSKKVTRH